MERHNRTVKENIRNIIQENNLQQNQWCTVLGEAAYKKNIIVNEATKETPYTLVFGIPPRKEEQMIDGTLEEHMQTQGDIQHNTEGSAGQYHCLLVLQFSLCY